MEDEMVRPAGTYGSGGLEARAGAARRSMEALREVVDFKVEEVRSSQDWDQKGSDLTALLRDLGKAVSLAVELEGKVQDARRIDRGGDGLDLDAARSEIGRRLDLRATAGRARGLDGGAE